MLLMYSKILFCACSFVFQIAYFTSFIEILVMAFKGIIVFILSGFDKNIKKKSVVVVDVVMCPPNLP